LRRGKQASMKARLDEQRNQILQFEDNLNRLGLIPLHPGIIALDYRLRTGTSADAGWSSTGSMPSGSAAGGSVREPLPPGSSSGMISPPPGPPRRSGDGSQAALDLGLSRRMSGGEPGGELPVPGDAAAGSGAATLLNGTPLALLDCINVGSWRTRWKMFHESYQEVWC
jgi:hypothetical protein